MDVLIVCVEDDVTVLRGLDDPWDFAERLAQHAGMPVRAAVVGAGDVADLGVGDVFDALQSGGSYACDTAVWRTFES